MSPRQVTLSTALACVAVFLMALSSFLLWRLLEETSEEERDAARPAAVAPPPVPEPRRGPSARALLRELDASTRRLTGPLSGVQLTLERAVRSLGVTERLPAQLDRLIASALAFERVPPQLAAVVAEVRRLGRVRGSLAGLLGEVKELRRAAGELGRLTRVVKAISRAVGGMAGSLSRIDDFTAGTRDTLEATLPRALAQLERMAGELERIRRCIQLPALCNVEPPPR